MARDYAALFYFIEVNIDNTLIGNTSEHLPELLDLLKENRKTIAFGVATGRTIDSAVNHLKKHGVHPLFFGLQLFVIFRFHCLSHFFGQIAHGLRGRILCVIFPGAIIFSIPRTKENLPVTGMDL